MAYRLQRDESVADGLRRIAAKAVKTARAELQRSRPPRDEAIHEARTRLKRARAIYALVEADDGKSLAGCRKRFRAANRTLSSLRDAMAMVEILEKLRSESPHLLSEHTFARLRRWVGARKHDRVEAAGRAEVWNGIDQELRKLRRAAKRWRPAHRGFGALAPGIHLLHQRGRKAMRRARESQQSADFHEWRKQMKALWYALRLVEGVDRSISRQVTALRHAERRLGDDHNLVVLCKELSKDATICGGAAEVDRLRLAADRYQCRLRKKAIAETQAIYRRKSKVFVRDIRRAWKTWRRTGNALTPLPSETAPRQLSRKPGQRRASPASGRRPHAGRDRATS